MNAKQEIEIRVRLEELASFADDTLREFAESTKMDDARLQEVDRRMRTLTADINAIKDMAYMARTQPAPQVLP